MKRKILLFFLSFVFFYIANAQVYELEIKGNIRTVGTRATCRHGFFIRFRYTDNTIENVHSVSLHNRENSDFTIDFRKTLTVAQAQRIERIDFYARRGRSRWGKCKIYGSSNESYYLDSTCSYQDLTNIFKGNKEVITTSNSFTLKLKPLLTLEHPVDNTISKNQSFNAKATSGFPTDTYLWQYNIEGSTKWKYVATKDITILGHTFTIPVSHGSTLTKKPSDFLTGDYIGKSIRFRIKLCNDSYINAPVTYYLIDVPPNIVTLNEEKNTCYYSSDGKISIYFERDLVAGEKMLIALYDEILPLSSTFRFYKSFQTENLTTIIDGIYRFTWPENLDSGNYQIKYQTVNRSDSQESWTQLTPSDTFTI